MRNYADVLAQNKKAFNPDLGLKTSVSKPAHFVVVHFVVLCSRFLDQSILYVNIIIS
jgi:hypothetical protein